MPSPADGRNDATKETPKFVSRAQSMDASLVSYWLARAAPLPHGAVSRGLGASSTSSTGADQPIDSPCKSEPGASPSEVTGMASQRQAEITGLLHLYI